MSNITPKTEPKQSETEWESSVGLTDEFTGTIGLFTVLRLIASADGGLGYICLYKNTKSSLLHFLHQADPTRQFWEITEHEHFFRVWRRKEWNESMEKVKADEVKKAAALITQAQYNEAKSVVMEFMLLLADGDRRAAERMFYAHGFANDTEALIKKAASLATLREKHEAKAAEPPANPEQMSKFAALAQRLAKK
ncbi:MAG: hypothetical protein EBT61_21370 [Verrucomicrobia bacterium]|nr:hypothetical protein [Verrucomicrobiota bacterium]